MAKRLIVLLAVVIMLATFTAVQAHDATLEQYVSVPAEAQVIKAVPPSYRVWYYNFIMKDCVIKRPVR